MSYELFDVKAKPALEESNDKHLMYLHDKFIRSDALGLVSQSKTIKGEIASIERGGRISTPALTEVELLLWRTWLPTVYTEDHTDQRFRFESYHFDMIPLPVLKQWQKHKESGLFEHFEIWTPEHIHEDPVLVGMNGTTVHMLARWGESDANLLSLDDIKTEIVKRWHRGDRLHGESRREALGRSDRSLASTITALVSVCFYAAIILITTSTFGPLDGSVGSNTFSFLCSGALVIALATYFITYEILTRRLVKRSKILRAIREHTPIMRERIPDDAL